MDYWEVEITAVRRLIAAHRDEFHALLAEAEKSAPVTGPGRPCGTCKRLHLDRPGIELAARLGHDRIGHRALDALWKAGYRTVRQVRKATGQELGTLEGISDTGIERIRYSLGLHDLVRAGQRQDRQNHPA
ncbi:hypothetical protein [Streptomyces lydicus]|uniref:hypothetical protein n=1 Tax=Streptomyces lydicus TaxID=47763 RepID=UPI001011BA3A|nr:hypothetical protein [Streptomyces lydicus]